MTSSDLWDAETAEHYDETSAFMFAPDVLEPAIRFLADLAGDGPALEFAIGTGRVAIPLVERGVSVSGIELSQPMVDKLQEKRTDIPAVVGDMATSTMPGQFSLVYIAWNGIGNLRTQGEQVACFRNAARHLAPGGRHRAVDPRHPALPARSGSSALPRRATPRRLRHVRHDHPAGHVPSLPTTLRRHGDIRRQQLPLHLASRVRPDGTTRRDGSRAPCRRLERQPLHKRQREPRLGLAQARLSL